MVLASCDPAAISDSTSGTVPSYQLTWRSKIDFGAKIQILYILDTYDVDGDGAEDFAIGAKIEPVDRSDFLNNKKINSFMVHNDAANGRFVPYNLGPDSLTHRTWAAAFYRPRGGAPTHLVLGRNGEIGPPNKLVGEPTTIYRILTQNGGLKIETAFVERTLGTTGSVDVCDIDGDGVQEIYVNNVGSPFRRRGSPFLISRIFQYANGTFVERDPRRYMVGMETGIEAHNYTAFEDIDRDGDCDFLAAREVHKPSAADPSITRSFVLINRQGSFREGRLFLPNTPFGRDNSAFGIASTVADSEVLVALTSSELKSFETGWQKFVLQIFALRNGQFVEVTDQKLVGRINNITANQSFVRFADIDGDGDDDLYISRYDRNAGVYVYLYEDGRFIGKEVRLRGPSGQKAVAFLNAPGKGCMDLAVLDANAQLFRYACR